MGRVFVTAAVPESEALTFTNPGQSFENLVADNPDLRIERTAQGEIIVMAPAHSRSGLQNAALTRCFLGVDVPSEVPDTG